MLIAALGMNHRSAPVEVRERVAFPPCARRQFLRRLGEEGAVAEAVLLSTCNRTEVYAVVEDEGARSRILRARVGEAPPVETATCSLPRRRVEGRAKSPSEGRSATLIGTPRSFASRATAALASLEFVAANAR